MVMNRKNKVFMGVIGIGRIEKMAYFIITVKRTGFCKTRVLTIMRNPSRRNNRRKKLYPFFI